MLVKILISRWFNNIFNFDYLECLIITRERHCTISQLSVVHDSGVDHADFSVTEGSFDGFVTAILNLKLFYEDAFF